MLAGVVLFPSLTEYVTHDRTPVRPHSDRNGAAVGIEPRILGLWFCSGSPRAPSCSALTHPDNIPFPPPKPGGGCKRGSFECRFEMARKVRVANLEMLPYFADFLDATTLARKCFGQSSDYMRYAFGTVRQREGRFRRIRKRRVMSDGPIWMRRIKAFPRLLPVKRIAG